MTRYSCLGYKRLKTKKGNNLLLVYGGYKDSNADGICVDLVFCEPDRVVGQLAVGSDFEVSYKRGSTFVEELSVI